MCQVTPLHCAVTECRHLKNILFHSIIAIEATDSNRKPETEELNDSRRQDDGTQHL